MRPVVRFLAICGLGAGIIGGQLAPRTASAAPGGSAHLLDRSRSPGAAGTSAVDAAAFSGMGSLAFRRDDGLYVLDGKSGAAHRVDSSNAVADLSWSADGRWLAYIARDPAKGGAGTLWVVRADGSDRHQVKGLPALVEFAAWSPVANTLAITLDTSAHPASWLWLAAPTGTPRPLSIEAPAATHWTSTSAPSWSPDGTLLAFTASESAPRGAGRSDTIYIAPAGGGRAVSLVTSQGNGIEIAGWWARGGGLLYLLDPMYSASLAADGMQLFSLPIGGRPALLTRSLASTYRFTLGYAEWLRWSPDGRSVLLVAGGGRPVWDGKRLAACDAFGAACHLLPLPAQGVVTLDPARSPDGSRLAYVQAKALTSFGFSGTGAFTAWIQTRTLWLAHPDGTGARQLKAAGTGVYWPHWTPDGRHLLYVRDHAVWLIDSRGGAPVRIASIISTEDDTYGYYGHVDWSGILAYTRGAAKVRGV